MVDEKNNNVIYSEKISHDRNKDFFVSSGKTKSYIQNKYNFISNDVIYDKKIQF